MICAHGREMLNEEDLKELEGLTAGTAIDLGDEPDDEPDQSFISEKHAYETFDMMRDSEVDVCHGCSCKIGERKDSGDADAAELNGVSDDDAGERFEESSQEVEDIMGTCRRPVSPQSAVTWIYRHGNFRIYVFSGD